MRGMTVAVVAATVLLVGACGDDDSDSAAEAGTSGLEDATTELEVIAEDIGFPAGSYETTAGAVGVRYVNEGSIRHTLLVEGVDGFELAVDSNGDVDEGVVELDAGDYTIYCDVPGHQAAGMEAQLRVS